MTNRFNYLIILIIVAAAMWFEMFVLRNFNFWKEMIIAAPLLALVSAYVNHRTGPAINYRLYYYKPSYILAGIISAAILYVVFFAGDYLSNLIFSFADTEVTGIYGNKALLDPYFIGALLFFVIGPAEEVFWRGFVQDTLAEKFGDNIGWIVGALLYAGVHIFALNFMLFMAALVCGLFWGYMFKRYKSLWPGIFSHALWDVVIFVLLPMR